jgi:hypothetical protein
MVARGVERARQYAAGEDLQEIAAQHGVTRGAVYQSIRHLVARTRRKAAYWRSAEAVRAMGSGSLRERARAAVAFLELEPELRRVRDEERRRREAELAPAREAELQRAIEELIRLADEP